MTAMGTRKPLLKTEDLTLHYGAAQALFGIDMAGCCVFVNRSAAQQLGWPAERILGRNGS